MDALTSPAPDPGPPLTVSALRAELGLTQIEFAARVGLSNKTSISLLESGQRPTISPQVALAIEALSGGRIDAAGLNPVIAAARDGQFAREQRTHGGDSAIDDPLPECAGDGVAGVVPHPGPAPETGRGAAAMRPGARALSGGRGQE